MCIRDSGCIGLKQSAEELLRKFQQWTCGMQINDHQPAFRLQESVAALQQLSSVAAWEFV